MGKTHDLLDFRSEHIIDFLGERSSYEKSRKPEELMELSLGDSSKMRLGLRCRWFKWM